jgi:hypothetical protein
MFQLKICGRNLITSELLRGISQMAEREESSNVKDQSVEKKKKLPVMEDAYLTIRKAKVKEG